MNFLKNEPTHVLLKVYWEYTRDTRKRVWVFMLFSVFAAAIWTIQPSLMAKLLNTIQQGGGVTAENQSFVILLIVGLLAVDLCAWFFHGISRVIENGIAFHSFTQYKKFLLEGIFSLPVSWHTEQDTGRVIDKVSKASDSLYSFGQNIYQIIHFFVRIIITATILFIFDWRIACISLLLIAISFFITYVFDIRLNRILNTLHVHENSVATRIVDGITNVLSVKILHIEQPVLRGISSEISKVATPTAQFYSLGEWKWFSGGMVFSIINLVPLLAYVWYVRTAGLVFEVGTFMALYLYSSNLINVYYTFNSQYEQIMRFRTRLTNASDIENAIRANSRPDRVQVTGWSSLTLKNVLFGYGNSQTPQVNVDSITIKKGEKIALLGSSGSGKTTFLKIIHGLYDTASGSYAIDKEHPRDTNFMDIDLLSMMVPQEPEVFSSTIKENITLGQDYSDVQVEEAMDIARFTEVLTVLPDGLDSVVNEKGVNLSGGQKQRLALARALLFAQEKELLLLDESTSSVDPVNEAKIYEGILDLWKHYTVMATIHKLNLLKYFERIIIFDKGKIIDDGSFEELFVRNEPFRRQWEEFVAQNNE